MMEQQKLERIKRQKEESKQQTDNAQQGRVIDPGLLILEEEKEDFFTERFPEQILVNSMNPEVALVHAREIRMKHLIKERQQALRSYSEVQNRASK